MSDFPTSVRVGYRTYAIERWEHREASAGSEYGSCSNHTGRIRVDEELVATDPVKAANTLIHEILHACWYVGNLDDKDEQERTVTVLANQFSHVWRDNPEVVAYLADCLKP